MNRKLFLHYVKQKVLTLKNNEKEISVTNIVTSLTNDILNAEVTVVEEKMQKFVKHLGRYQEAIPENVKKDVEIFANTIGTTSAIKKFSLIYDKYSFNWTSVNAW